MGELRRVRGVATGFVVGAGLATIVGVSAHGGNTALIHACVNHEGGMRIVGASDSCKQNETPLDWNVEGPKGDTGLAGPQGDIGPQGPKGDTGASGPPGTFTGVFTSPNQAFKLSVTDDGIEMAGPQGVVRVTPTGVDVASNSASIKLDGTGMDLESQLLMKAKSGLSMEIDSLVTTVNATALLNLKGGVVLLNGTQIP